MLRRAHAASGTIVLTLALAALAPQAGCSSTMIAVRESLGQPKREQLARKVEATRDSQEAAKKQFASALDEFIAITGVKPGELESRYRSLNAAYERAESRADTVRSRIRETQRVADSLFAEWQRELGQYSDASLRAASERQMMETRGRYDQLIGAMNAAAAKMDPVLSAFKDRVLFLKHNLNAQAIAALQGNVGQIQGDVGSLIAEMERSIAEANSFISQMQQKP